MLADHMLSISAERLADFVLTTLEAPNVLHRRELPEDMTLKLEDVAFRYASDDDPLLKVANLTVKPGECVAIIGCSGCGKTTLLKLMLGTLKPERRQANGGHLGREHIDNL